MSCKGGGGGGGFHEDTQHARCVSLMYSFQLGGLRFSHSSLEEIQEFFKRCLKPELHKMCRFCCHLLATCRYN